IKRLSLFTFTLKSRAFSASCPAACNLLQNRLGILLKSTSLNVVNLYILFAGTLLTAKRLGFKNTT
ncbi:unnamed protein product, partial [Schistosoma curassoni]|uniref:Ovule protein n=1 Tax=Schistosoma curassoni TaxID=6186 RepID=A0A183JPA2_9TREM